MKKSYSNKKTRIFTANLLFIISLLVFYSCKKPTDGIKVIVNTGTLSKSPVLIHFTNANITSSNQPGDFTVTVTGKDSALVQMDGGGTKMAASHGFLPLSLSRSATLSKNNPISFNVTASVSGFTPVTQTITLNSDSAKTIFEIKLIEYANPAPGTTALVNTSPLSAGTTASVINLTTPTTSSVPQNATLSIPAGTQMLDASGALINAGSLNANIVQFNSGTPSIINSFPGSMKANLALDKNGKLIQGGVNFVTAGMLAINMTAGTSTVKSFSKPVSMSIELQSGLINFGTGKAVAVGDTIPLWSYNENNGVWKNEGTATAYVDANNKLAAKANITHLSYWNLDWSWGYFGGYNTSYNPLSINLTSNTTNWSGLYEVELQSPDGNYLAGFHSYQPQYDYYQSYVRYTYYYYWYGFAYSWFDYYYYTQYNKYGFGMTEIPYTTQAKIAVYDLMQGYTKVGESGIFNPLSAGSVTVNVTTPPPPDYVKVNFNIKGNCSTKDISIGISGWFYLYDYSAALRGQWAYTYIYIYNGQIYNWGYNDNSQITNNGGSLSGSIQMISGDQYYLESWNNYTWYFTSFVFNKSSFSLPASNNISGSVVYNSATNTSTVNGAISVNCN